FCRAEDGIRDFHVTGVQTCALPISNSDANQRATEANKTTAEVQNKLIDFIEKQAREMEKINEIRRAQTEAMERIAVAQEATVKQIGRASCREREKSAEVTASVKKTR